MATLSINEQLLDAVIGNHVNQVQALLEQGANPNFFEDEAQLCTLHFAATYDCAEVIPLLITAGANIHAVNEYYDTPLTVAKRHGHTRSIEALTRLYTATVDHAN